MKIHDMDNCEGFQLKDQQGEEIALSMQELWVSGTVLPVGADLVWRHTFQCAGDSPVEAIYAFALPRDASLHSFRIVGEGFNVESRLEEVEKAREAYEEGIAKGSLSTLAEQHRDGIVNLSVGNIRPDEVVTVYLRMLLGVEPSGSGFRLRLPFTLAPGYHPAARYIDTGNGSGEIDLPADQFGDVLLPPFAKDAGSLHRIGFDLDIRMPSREVKGLSSPSHPVSVDMGEEDSMRVSLAVKGDLPNRDLVLDASVKDKKPLVLAGVSSKGRGEFIGVLPSSMFGEPREEAHRIIFLLDRSGSMNGQAIEEAKKAIVKCMRTLGPKDAFNIVAFDTEIESAFPEMLSGGDDNVCAACAFLETIGARGGTDIALGIDTAAKLAEGAGAAVFLITDGQVFGTEDILARANMCGIAIHTLGIGAAARDRFISQLARGTGGVSRSLNPNERIAEVAQEVFAGIGSPLASALSVSIEGIEASVLETNTQASIFSGNPFIVYGEMPHPGEYKLLIEWEQPEKGILSIDIDVSENAVMGETLRLLRGAKMLNDQDSMSTGEGESENKLLQLSREYGLSSPAMSLVAVVDREDDEAGKPPVTSVVPVGMPNGVAFGAYFPNQQDMGMGYVTDSSYSHYESQMCYSKKPDIEKCPKRISRSVETYETITTDYLINEIVSQIAPDGGIEGEQDLERVIKSVLALRLLITCPIKKYKKYERRLHTYLLSAGNRVIPDIGKHLDQGLSILDMTVFSAYDIEGDEEHWCLAAKVYICEVYEFLNVARCLR